jgi:hypothetical protein
MAKVRALMVVRDIVTDRLYQPGEVFDLDRRSEALVILMQDGIVEVLDPDVRPGVLVSPAPVRPNLVRNDEERDTADAAVADAAMTDAAGREERVSNGSER